MDVTDIIGSLGIAGLVYIVIEALGDLVPSKAKPPLAILLAVGWSMVAYATVDGAYPNALTAVATAITAGASASGIASMRTTYQRGG